jgi:endonuclease/exonuclease/phosphatase family metal-dependent hydrolase
VKTHYLAFWNVENLFDTVDSPVRPEWLQKTLAKELEGWDSEILDRKIGQLSFIIRQMNGGMGPDVLGLCEVENGPVLEKLVQGLAPLGRQYEIAHHDTSDKRGIDIAFIYDSNKFTAQEQFFHVIIKRSATRDIFQVNFETSGGRELIAIGNHWPSRSGGELESEPYRMTAGQTLSHWMERIEEIKGDDAAVIVMGDFNDEPFNRSITDYALAGNSATKVLNSRSPRFFNLMWPFLGQGFGTHYFDNFPNVLDQFWVSKGIVNGRSGFRVELGSAKIEKYPPMVTPGSYPVPARFGRPAGQLNKDGFSDHYPVSVMLLEES